MRKRELALGAFLIVFAVTSGVIHLPISREAGRAGAAGGEIYNKLELFGDVLEQVRANYVVKPDDSKLIENAIKGVLSGLDPHSSYLSPREVQEEQAETKGEFGGLGIDVTMEDGAVKVVAPIDNIRRNALACSQAISSPQSMGSRSGASAWTRRSTRCAGRSARRSR